MSQPRGRLFRDALGVPHLRARDELDLAFAQGHVTALDRAWQVEVDRWRAEGRTAAHLGAEGLEWDRYAARTRLEDTARQAYAALDDADRAWVDAYVEGVNAGLPEGRAASPELAHLAGLPGEAPAHEPWEPWVPLGIFHVAHTLMSSFPNVLWRAHVARTLGPEHVARFVTGQGGGGSNAWAVAGVRTRHGAPILAGDPHRLLELPGVYQQVRLACDDYDVVGLAFPGVPGIQHFGHAGEVAWGVTNAVAHVDEVVEERVVSREPFVVEGPQGAEPVDVVERRLVVRGADPETVRCIETRRGTVLVEDPTCLAVRQAPRVRGDLGFSAFRPLLRARSAADVLGALERWVGPVNRVLAADRDEVLRGTVGRWPAVPRDERWLPRRAWEERPEPGSGGWPDALPVERVATWAVDANERPVDRPAHDLGDSYPPADRARRITALVADLEDATADDLARVHGDTLLLAAGRLVDRLRQACGVRPPSPAAREVLEELEQWDGRMDADGVAAATFARWRSALVRRLVAHPGLAPLATPHGTGALFDPWFGVAGRVAASLEALLDAAELGIDGDAELVAALEAVAGLPATTWGATHRLLGLHVLGWGVAGAAAAPPVPLSGDGETVLSTASVPGAADVSWSGSVARWVWDLDDRANSRWNVPFGASGVPGSPHHADQLDDWTQARTTAVETDWTRLVEHPWRPA